MDPKIESYYFPLGLRWTILIVAIIASPLLVVNGYYWIVFPVAALTGLIFSLKNVILISLPKKTIQDEWRVADIIFQSIKISFVQLDRIEIAKERHTYTANSRGRTGYTDYFEYIATLVYDGSQEFELSRNVSYTALAEELETVTHVLALPIVRK